MDYYYHNSGDMPSRGRFPPRGAYRGGGRGDSYRGSRGYPSRPYSPRGRGGIGAGGGGSYYPKYDHSASSSFNSKYNSDTSKYSSHQRFEESPYRKSESSYLSARDHSHRSEMELSRKRMRNDSYSQSQGSGSRRNHEVEDYRGSSRYVPSSSYTSQDSRSYGERSVFKKPRISEYKPKDDFRSPRKEMSRPSMVMSRIRTMRGRGIRGRGYGSRVDTFIPRKRPTFTTGRSSASTAELLALRRAKLLKIRRLRTEQLKRIKDNNDNDETKSGDKGDAAKEDGDKEKEETEEGDTTKKKEKKDKDEEEEKDEKEGKDKAKKEDVRTDYFGKPFIKLQCPHCSIKCVTFKEYVQHLYHPVHVKAMRDRSIMLKTTLARMRVAQRAKQKKTDEEDLTSLDTRSLFCPICKLNYSQSKSEHQNSEAHKKMKNFLLPYCKICHISFKTPMLYEGHICSLEHVRRKHVYDERMEKKNASPGSLDNFMVLDSIGSGDEADESRDEEVKNDGDDKEEKPSTDEDLNLGSEYIRKVEVYFCELCRYYLPRLSDLKKVMRIHCRGKKHLRCYLRYSNNDLLDKIKEMEGQIEEDEDKKKAKTEAAASGEEGKKADSVEDEVGIDDKMWADVGDILSQVEPEVKSDDEDEEESHGRFDKFKSNEKKENGEAVSGETTEVAAEVAVKEEVKDSSVVKPEA